MSVTTFTAFLRDRRLATGSLAEIFGALAELKDGRAAQVFNDATGDLVKLGRPEEVARAVAEPIGSAAGPVELRITVLPRHAAWLEAQPGGASGAMRRLIDAARREGVGRERQARDAAYRFISMMAGDRPGFEEACRALYAGDADRFATATEGWPDDVRRYGQRLAAGGWVEVIRQPAPVA